jgi:predicted nucleic acid-binding protein
VTEPGPGLLDTSVFIARETARPLRDALIAATAVAHGLPVVTEDDDYDRIATVHAP